MILDSALGSRLHQELTDIIEKRKQALVNDTSDRAAGHIQGLQEALNLIGGTIDKLNNPERPRGG